MADKVVFTAEVDKDVAKKFDAIAKDNYRSRTAHLQFLIEKEASGAS